MNKKALILALSVSSIMSAAHAGPLEGCGGLYSDMWDNCSEASSVSLITTFSPTILTFNASNNLSARHNKIILAAKPDAQLFVATEGREYGVQLASAIEVLRAELPQVANANDMEIAQAILAY